MLHYPGSPVLGLSPPSTTILPDVWIVLRMVLVLAVGAVIGFMVRWWMRPREPTRAEKQMARFDGYLECDKAEVWDTPNQGVSRPGLAAAAGFKERYGEMKYNLANRAIAGDFVRQFLREEYPTMRTVDRIRHVEMAIEMALTPTMYAVDAASYARDETVRRRRGLVQAPR